MRIFGFFNGVPSFRGRDYRFAPDQALTQNPGQAPRPEPASGVEVYLGLRNYVALLSIYACGIGAVLHQSVPTIAALAKAERMDMNGKMEPLLDNLHAWFVEPEWFRGLSRLENARVPVSERLRSVLVGTIDTVGASETAFDDAFDEWEVIVALTYSDNGSQRGMGHLAPIGRFCYRNRNAGVRSAVVRLRGELEAAGEGWKYLQAGLFGGDAARATLAIAEMLKQPEMRRLG